MGQMCGKEGPAGDRQVLGQEGMVIYGDYTNSDTRAILAALRISGMAFQFVNLDVLSNQHQSNEIF